MEAQNTPNLEINDKIVTPNSNEENVVEQDEEALDKTMCFRMISVDEDDIISDSSPDTDGNIDEPLNTEENSLTNGDIN